MKRKITLSILTCLSLLAGTGCLQPSRMEIRKALKAPEEDLQWFQEARYGLFIHWGPISLKGTEISWSRITPRYTHGTVPAAEYDNLYRQFNPTKFDAKQWVALAKAAGMKYLVFTTKHHDGFCMFNSRYTNYKITNTPFRRDVTAEIAQACHQAGMKLGFYYSPPDFHHPDYRTKNHARYIRYMHDQLRELCTQYGKVDIIWFDGLNGTSADWDSEKLFALIRKLQPGILLNNRAGLPADYDTPEQTVGMFQNNRPWESCITIGDQWSYKPNENLKSVDKIIQTLAQCAGGDGNLLFNVGPLPTGEIEPAQIERLKKVGEWLAKYGESIYGTRGGPFVFQGWGVSTHRGNTIYLHVFNRMKDTIRLPAMSRKIVSCAALTGGTAEFQQTDQGTEIRLPAGHRNLADTLIELTLDGETPPLIVVPSLGQGKEAAASNVYQNDKQFSADKAVDGNMNTRWATDNKQLTAWLAVDLGEVTTFNRVLICELFDRIQNYELQIRSGENWRTIHTGTKIGGNCNLDFDPVSAREVRLNIIKASDGPSISEFRLYND